MLHYLDFSKLLRPMSCVNFGIRDLCLSLSPQKTIIYDCLIPNLTPWVMEQNVNDQCVFPIEPVFWFLKYTTYPPNPHSSQGKAYMQY